MNLLKKFSCIGLEIYLILWDSLSTIQYWLLYRLFPWFFFQGRWWGFSYSFSFLSFNKLCSVQFSSVQSLSRVWLFATPWITAYQASLSITNSWSSPRLTSFELVIPSSHLILCRPLLLLPPIPPGIRVFSNESTFRMRWPKYWSFSFSISPSNCHASVCSLVLCLVTTKIWSNGH